MLSVKENNNATIICNVKSPVNGAPQNITGWSFEFQVRYNNGAVLIDKNSSDITQIAIISAMTGLVNVYIKPTDTSGSSGDGYIYEFKGTDSAGNKYTLDGLAQFIITPTQI